MNRHSETADRMPQQSFKAELDTYSRYISLATTVFLRLLGITSRLTYLIPQIRRVVVDVGCQSCIPKLSTPTPTLDPSPNK